MIFWLIAGALTALVLMLLLRPLARRAAPAETSGRAEYDLAVYRDQLAEIERDTARGVLTPEQAQAARVEVERRMLATLDRAQDETPQAPRASSRAVLAVLTVALPLAGLSAYLALGAPDVPGQPFAERRAEGINLADMAARVDGLAQRLEKEPNDPAGWAMLARSYRALERWSEAVGAYRRAVELTGDVDLLADLSETIVLSQDGAVSPEAAALFAKIAEVAPGHPKALYYLGLVAMQAGKPRDGLAIWRGLEESSPPDAPWLGFLRGRMAEVAKAEGIDPASVEPAPPPPPPPALAGRAAPSKAEGGQPADPPKAN